MLDSVGDHDWVVVECGTSSCPVRFELPTYTPKFGHAGEELNEGPYYDRVSGDDNLKRVFESGRLFKVIREGDRPEVEVYGMRPRYDYAYGRAFMPDFGKKEGEVIWFCKRCVGSLQFFYPHWAEVLTRAKQYPPCLADG